MRNGKTYKLIVSESTEIKDSIDADTKNLIISGVCDFDTLNEYFRCYEDLKITTLDLSELKVTNNEFGFINWFDYLRTVIYPRNQETIFTDFNISLRDYVFPNNLKKVTKRRIFGVIAIIHIFSLSHIAAIAATKLIQRKRSTML